MVPSPSSPTALLPQHFTPPPVVRAQVWEVPAEMAATPEVRPETSTGVVLSVVVPFPSWPQSLNPQHFAPPPVVTAQACKVPAEIAVAPALRTATAPGAGVPVA